MKFKLIVKDDRSIPSEEDYEKDITDAYEWGIKTIEFFNNTLRPGEHKRELVDVKIIDDDNTRFHKWEKRTDGMSRLVKIRQSDKDTMIADVYYCKKCGITGKKFGLRSDIHRDWKYRAKKYERCSK